MVLSVKNTDLNATDPRWSLSCMKILSSAFSSRRSNTVVRACFIVLPTLMISPPSSQELLWQIANRCPNQEPIQIVGKKKNTQTSLESHLSHRCHWCVSQFSHPELLVTEVRSRPSARLMPCANRVLPVAPDNL